MSEKNSGYLKDWISIPTKICYTQNIVTCPRATSISCRSLVLLEQKGQYPLLFRKEQKWRTFHTDFQHPKSGWALWQKIRDQKRLSVAWFHQT